MSQYTETIHCSDSGCDEKLVISFPDEVETQTQEDKLIEDTLDGAGWIVRAGRHLCPDHKAELESIESGAWRGK